MAGAVKMFREKKIETNMLQGGEMYEMICHTECSRAVMEFSICDSCL